MPRQRNCYNLHVTVFDRDVSEVARRFARAFRLGHKIQWYPHVTILSHFWLRQNASEEQLLNIIGERARTFAYLPLTVDGFSLLANHIDGNYAIAHRVVPSGDFTAFWYPLAKRLFHYSLFPPNIPIAQAENTTDLYPEKKSLHITIAHRLCRDDADLLCQGMQGQPGIRPLERTVDVVRLTLSKNMRIYAEYDIPRKTWLFGRDIFSRLEWAETAEAYEERKAPDITTTHVEKTIAKHYQKRKEK